MVSLEVPSKVTDRKHIYMPQQEKVIESDEEWERCGKWILSSVDADLDFVDGAWTDLQPLLGDGTLIMLKASTLAMKDEGAYVLCFTRPGKEEAKRAADVIRKCVDYRCIMYYKLNQDTTAGIDGRFGHTQFAKYMHTYLGRFYIRDWIDRWAWDDEVNKEISVSSQFCRKNYSGVGVLPSKSAKCISYLKQANDQRSVVNWYLYCSRLEDDAYLPEVDRVWIVAKRLFDEGVFLDMSFGKSGKNADKAEIRLFVPEDSDVFSQLKYCERIFKEASVEGIIYLRRGNAAVVLDQIRPKYSYKYTSKGELYKTTKDAQIFVPL